jgi:diguanylate cyclase (GGDEF)-like protein/putative nucleotidyltransferase with HDIG domain
MSWAELPAKLKVYILLLAVIASPILLWATWDLLANPHSNLWIALTVLALATVPLCFLIPSFSATITIGDAYIMAIAMMYGISPCIIATFLHIFFISIFAQRPKVYAYKVVYNTSSTVCGAFIYSLIYQAMNHGSPKIQDVVIPAAVLVLTYFFVNSILTSIAISWSIGENIFNFWAKSCAPLAVDYSVSAVIATFFVVLSGFNEYIPFAVAPFVGVVWAWNHLNKTRLAQAEKHMQEQEQLYLRTVESLALAVDAKDQTTYGHIRRVRAYATGLARLCGIKDANELKAIETGALLHDIGKIAIDDYILNKPGRLTKNEFEKVKMHTTAGDEILQQVQFPFPVAKCVRSHHERWDGLGYPDGLKAEEIPIGARILAVADAFDAIRFSRPYKLSLPTDEAIEVLNSQAGIVYDPNLVRLFTDHIDELEQTAIKESENAPELSFRKYFETDDSAFSNPSKNALANQDIPACLLQFAEFCSTISGHIDLKDMLPILMRRIEQLVPFSTGAVYLGNDRNAIAAAYVRGKFSEMIQGHILEMGKGISGWAAAYNRPMMNTDPALDFQGMQGDFASFTDVLVVPITYENETLGTISLYAQAPVSYKSQDLNVLRMLAGLLAPLVAESRKHNFSEQDGIDPTTQIHRISYLAAVGPELIYNAGQNRSPLSLIYIEIKNFIPIIRIFGNPLGNSILQRVADCIKPELRETDILVRYGNHGFAALLPGVRDEQALRCVQRLKEQIRREFIASSQGFSVDFAAGVSVYPKDGTTVFALIQSAQKNIRTDFHEAADANNNVVDFSPRL